MVCEGDVVPVVLWVVVVHRSGTRLYLSQVTIIATTTCHVRALIMNAERRAAQPGTGGAIPNR